MTPRDQLISSEYLAQQRALHVTEPGYGGKGLRWVDTVLWLRQRVGASSVLDYGCGKGSLARALAARTVSCLEYDPAIAGKDRVPGFADLVVCTDVLEHVEPDRLLAVLKHLAALARKAIFLVVCLRPSHSTLHDGRNAHLLQEPREWWIARVREAGLTILDLPDLPLPPKVAPEKFWIAGAVPV